MANTMALENEGDEKEEALFLGLDASTQQLKVVAINSKAQVVAEESVVFDSLNYGTQNGAVENGLEVRSPTLMWVHALDVLLDRLKAKAFPFSAVRAISGCGQQHGSVFWRKGAAETLRSLDAARPLHTQLDCAFSISFGPIWRDSSTGKECTEMEELIGGSENMARVSGSKAYERFTGPQILKLSRSEKEAFADTERISLVSSFVASLITGFYAPIDWSDGSGMNLLDIQTKTWNPTLLSVFGNIPLTTLLGDPVSPETVVGNVSSYFSARFGFPVDCAVVSFTGDNPATLASFATQPGDIVVSLGTSDTLFLTLESPIPSLDASVFVHPTCTHAYMGMLCYKNGSLAREATRDALPNATLCADVSLRWKIFENAASNESPKDAFGKRLPVFGFYFAAPEILPKCMGTFRFMGDQNLVEDFLDTTWNARAILESQFYSMKHYSTSLGLEAVKRIIVTGGGSRNPSIQRALSDIFGVPVFQSTQPSNSASLGGAYRALYGHKRACHVRSGPPVSFDEFLQKLVGLKKVLDPDMKAFAEHEERMSDYLKCLKRACELGAF